MTMLIAHRFPTKFWSTRTEEVSVAHDGRGRDEDEQSEEDKHFGAAACTSPLMQGYTPESAEDDDAGHVEGPTGEAVLFAHLSFAHGVEEELQVPCEAGDGREYVVAKLRCRGGLAGRDAEIFAEGFVAKAED